MSETLIDRWKRIAAGSRDIADGRDPLQQRPLDGLALGLETAIREIEAACTPRPPRPEWFGSPLDEEGKPTGKWDSWWIQWDDGHGDICHGAICMWWCNVPTSCVPVAREGFPAPVGWSVIGG